MKKQLLIIIAVCFSMGLYAQKQPDDKFELPIKDSVIFFEGVVQTDSTFNKTALYAKAREWFVNYYKSANDVIQMDDKGEGKLIGKGIHPYVFVNGLNIHNINLLFTINITVKDGKYRYQIYDFKGEDKNVSMLSGQTVDNIYYNAEYNRLIADGSRKKYRTKLLDGLKTEVLAIVLSLEKSMKSKPSNDF